MSWGVNILPKVNNTYTLGNSDYKWNIFVNKINNQSIEGFGLPAIASADEGKILKVNNGAWAMTSDLKLTNGDLILTTTLSKGRKANTTIGTGSIAFGTDVTASGEYSQAFGGSTVASGDFSFASGIMTNASGFGSHAEGLGIHNSDNTPNSLYGARGLYSHVEGNYTSAYRQYTHAQGYYSDAVGVGSHAEGYRGGAYGKFTHAGGVYGYAYGDGSFSHGLYTQAHGEGSYALGSCNVADISFTAWEANHQYAVGDIVWHYGTGNTFGERAFDEHGFHYYKCKIANSDATFDATKWDEHVYSKFIEMIGNGAYDWENETELYFSNARALDWQGNEYLNGDLYVNCENDSTGGSKVATESYVTTAFSNVTIRRTDITIIQDKYIELGGAETAYSGWDCTDFIDLAGEDVFKYFINCTYDDTYNAFYTSDKTFISNFTSSTGENKIDIPATARYARLSFLRAWTPSLIVYKKVTTPDIQINSVSIVNNGVANIPMAGNNTLGVVKPAGTGVNVDKYGNLVLSTASSAHIKAGTNNFVALTPGRENETVFYGLAKAAGEDMSSSSNPVGTFTDAAKVAIQKMLGIYEASWELIREDTFTNDTEADHYIEVDGNGDSFELTDIVILFEFPNVATAASKTDDRFFFYYSSSESVVTYGGNMSRNADGSAMGTWQIVEQKNGMVFSAGQYRAITYNAGNLQLRYHSTNPQGNGFFFPNSPLTFTKVRIPAVTGTGHYKLYGKRKWR